MTIKMYGTKHILTMIVREIHVEKNIYSSDILTYTHPKHDGITK